MPGLVDIPDVNGKEPDENQEGTETKVVNHNVEVESDRRYPKRVNVKLPNKFNDYVVGNDEDKLPGGRLNKKDGLTRYGNSHVKDKTS